MNRIWMDIKNYQGIYKISNFGEILKISYRGTKKAKLCKLYKNEKGYYKITLYKNKKPKTFFVHVLVLEAFVGEKPTNMECCHNNHIRNNNYVKNLRWDTHKNNMKDAINQGTFNFKNRRRGSNCSWAKVNEQIVKNIVQKLKDGMSMYRISKDMDIPYSIIKDIKNKKTWKHIYEN